MTVDILLQARFFLSSFLAGLAMGALCGFFRLCLALFGVTAPPARMHPYYMRPLPLLRAPLGIPAIRRGGRVCTAVLEALGALLLPSIGALMLAVVTFSRNDGVLRPSAVLLFLLGFFLWRRQIDKHIAPVVWWLAWGTRLCVRYLLALLFFPPRMFGRLFAFLVIRPLLRLTRTLILRYRLARTAKLLKREVAAARRGFEITI